MKSPRGTSLVTVLLLAFFGVEPAGAQPASVAPITNGIATPDPQTLLAQARQRALSIACYETTELHKTNDGGVMTIRRRFWNRPDGTQLKLTNRYVAHEGIAKLTSRILSDERGDWRLMDRATIKIPHSGIDANRTKIADALDATALAENVEPPRYTIAPDILNDRPVFVVACQFSAADIARKVAVMDRLSRQKGSPLAGIKADVITEGRREYWIDARDTFIVRTRSLGTKGTVLTDDVLSSFDLTPAANPDAFAIPADRPTLIPKDDEEYRRLSIAYAQPRSGGRTNNNK